MPEINKVEPLVWMADATNLVSIEGKTLHELQGLWTSRHGLLPSKDLAATPQDNGRQLQLTIPIDGLEAPGPFAIRLITTNGVSAPVMSMLECIAELKPDADGFLSGMGFINGSINKADGARFQVKLKRNHQLNADVSAGRFGSKLDPVMRVLDRDGKVLHYLQDSSAVGVDCSVEFRAPKDGEYLLDIRDAQYGSGKDLRFHLRYGVEVGGFSSSWVYGPVQEPDGMNWRESFRRRELANKQLGIICLSTKFGGVGFFGYRLFPVSMYPVTEFNPPLDAKTNQETARPVADGNSINAFLTGSAEVQVFNLQINEAGSRRFTAMSRRLGGERDPVMRLKSGDGTTLKDSHLFQNEAVLIHDFKEPGSYQLEVWDSAGQHGDFGGYHIRIERDPAEFELNTETDSLRIPAGGESELSVTIERDGYDGPVKIELANGPEGVELTDAVAKEKSKEAKFKLKLVGSLAPGTTFPLKLSGRRGEGDNAPKTPLYTSAYWKKRFPDLYSPMFEFEDTVWVTVLPP